MSALFSQLEGDTRSQLNHTRFTCRSEFPECAALDVIKVEINVLELRVIEGIECFKAQLENGGFVSE